MALYGSIDDHMKVSRNETTSDRSLSGRTTSWTSHVTVTFTSTVLGPVLADAMCSAMYESGAVNMQCRLNLETSGGTNYYSQLYTAGMQMANNYAQMSSGAMSWVFENVAAGTHVLRAQYRNMGNSSTGILSYWDQGGQDAYDQVQAIYRG
tara:strand:+ start:35 stop:487 length:453 start_codon:yes stop_codon:yes gene_type:complete